jgi:hypothetical protein
MDIIDNENDHYEQEVGSIEIVNPAESASCESLVPKKRGRKPKKSIVAQEENLLGNSGDLCLKSKDGEKDLDNNNILNDNKGVDINTKKIESI